MSLQTMSIINRATHKNQKYNILTFDTHERYQTQLCKTGHNFYSFGYEGAKEWDSTYAPKPKNYYTLPKNSIIKAVQFDLILSQRKFGQFQAAHQINSMFKVPIVSLEHTLPIPGWPDEQLETFKRMTGDVNVFISEYSTKKWGMKCDNTVVHHSVDSEVFKPAAVERKPVVLSGVNDFANRDYCCNYSGWQRITEAIKQQDIGLDIKLVGNCSQGLSKPAKSVQDLVNEYSSCQMFLNTSTISPVPSCLLEAMSCGCPVVSTATCMIPEIIENGVNGFMSNDEAELQGYIKQLSEDEELRVRMGEEARKTILEKFSEQNFIDNWNKIFDKAYGVNK